MINKMFGERNHYRPADFMETQKIKVPWNTQKLAEHCYFKERSVSSARQISGQCLNDLERMER